MQTNFDLMIVNRLRARAGFLCCPVFLAALCLLNVACSRSAEERRAAVHELQAKPTERNLRRLRELLGDSDRDVRATALHALGECGEPDAAELALQALRDDDEFVRATAARLLGSVGRPEHAVKLAHSLLEDAEPRVRQHAAESLGLLGGESAVQALLVGLEDPMQQVRLAAVQGLRRLDPGSAAAVLSRRVVEDPAWEVRVQAAQALAESEDPQVLNSLQAALEDPNEHVRAAAAAALRIREQGRDDAGLVRGEAGPSGVP